MTEIKWAWSILLSVSAIIAGASYFRIGLDKIFWVGLTTLFRGGLFFCVVYIISAKIYGIYTRWNKTQDVSDQIYKTPKSDEKIQQARNGMQSKLDKQADSYKERILEPRDEAKKKKREEEYYKFLGPAWKGKGHELGGDDLRSNHSEGAQPDDSHEAKVVRRLPEGVRLHVPREEQTSNTKQKIILPEEPSADSADTTLIVLRSPLGISHSRRFLNESKLQVIFDYMTTLGFSKKKFTLSRSYPRQPLTNQSEDTLSQLNFGKKAVLNIEEIDD